MIKLIYKKNKEQLILLLIGLLWIFILSFSLQFRYQTYIFPDTYSYLQAINQFYFDFTLNDHRPFLFSLLNGMPLLFDSTINFIFNWSVLLNLLSWFGTILIIYSILSKIVDKKKAFFFSLIYIFFIGSLSICFHLLTEPIFTFLLVLIIYYLQKFEFSKNIKFLTFALSILLLSLLIKPILKFFIIIFILFYLKSVFKILKSKFSAVLFFILSLIFIQMYSIKKTYGHFTLSYIDVSTYYNYLGTRAVCYKTNTEFNQDDNLRKNYFSKLTYDEQKRVAYNDVIHQLKNNKLNLLKAYFTNLYINSSKGSASVFACENIKRTIFFDQILYFFKGVSKIQNIFLSFLGLLFSIVSLFKWRRTTSVMKIITLAYLYIFLISGISSDQGDRLHIVFYPIVLLLMVNFISIIFKPFAELLQK